MCHKSVLERKRKDPQNSESFVKICDKCNKNYLERQLLMPFWKNCQKIKIVVDDRERNYDKLSEKLNKIETEIVNIKRLVRVTDIERNKRVRCRTKVRKNRGAAKRDDFRIRTNER